MRYNDKESFKEGYNAFEQHLDDRDFLRIRYCLYEALSPSFDYKYKLIGVEYLSKWVETMLTRANDHKVMLKFLKEHVFAKWGFFVPLLVLEE